MDGLQINQKIRYGYAKAAKKLGEPYSLYRAQGLTPSINPIVSGNLIGVLPMVPTQSWGWMKGNKPGNAIWYMCVDGQDSSLPLAAIEGDFLIGDHTFFVLSKEFQMPMQGIETNDTVQIERPYQSIAAGGQGYAEAYGNPTILMQGMPASILILGRGRQATTKLPTDTSLPEWTIHVPNFGDVNLRTGDIVIDSTNERYILSATESTEFGWRLTAQKMVV